MLKNARFYSGVVAGAREALIGGVPSISISLNWLVDVLFSILSFTAACLLSLKYFFFIYFTSGRRIKAKKVISRMLFRSVCL